MAHLVFLLEDWEMSLFCLIQMEYLLLEVILHVDILLAIRSDGKNEMEYKYYYNFSHKEK